jgi:alginate O-acetyltransferase complex protein AlgI
MRRAFKRAATIMKLEFIFLLVIIFTTPLIWNVSKFWHEKIMLTISLLVLGWLAPLSLLLMLFVATAQWLLWRYGMTRLKRIGFLLSISLPLIPLIVYKLGQNSDGWILPLGLSYYAFRQIHVAFEYYKGEIKSISLEAYYQYLVFLPVILIGPIHRMPEFQRSLRRLKWQPVLFSEGLERILYGLVKIGFLGNYLFSAKLIQYAHTLEPSGFKIYVEAVAFTCNAYVQFSGFSDLAIGMSLLWGIRITENFNHPFLATNMQDFWQRWHISLSSWCRDYVFQPLMALSRNRIMALVAAMLVLSLWHEISIRYILWGSVQAALIIATVQARKALPLFSKFINGHAIGKWMGRIWVFNLFTLSSMLIGTESLNSLVITFKQLIR